MKQSHHEAGDSFRWVFEHSVEALLIVDGQGQIRHANAAAARLFGYSTDQLHQRPLGDLVPERFRGRHAELYADYAHQPRERRIGSGLSVIGVRADGSEFPIEVSLSPRPDGYVLAIVQDISERLNMERRLADASRFNQTVLDSLPASVCVIDEDGRIIAGNRRWQESGAGMLTGSECVGGNYWGALTACLAEGGAPEALRAAVESVLFRRSAEFCREYICRGRWFEIRVSPCGSEVLPKAVIVHSDITLRRERESERRRFELLIEHAGECVAMTDRVGRLTYLNAAGRRLLSLPDDASLTNFRIADLLTEESSRVIRRQGLAFARARRSWAGELRLRRAADDGLIDVECSLFAIPGDSRRVAGFGAVVRDVTERKAAYDLLASSNARLRVATEIANLAVWDVNRESGVMTFSAEWKRQLGYAADEIADRWEEWESRLHPDDRARAVESIRADLAVPGARYDQEFRLRHRDGSYRWMHSRGTLLTGADTRAAHLTGVNLDITERRQAEQARRARQLESERDTNAEIASQTVAALAHELNQPLNAVAAYSEAALRLLQGDRFDRDKLAHAVEQSARQAQRAGRVIRELMSFLRGSAIVTEVLDLNEVVRTTLAQIDTDGLLGSFSAKLDLADPLPKVRACRVQIEKVLTNLLRNAVEAMREADHATGRIVVNVRTSDCGSYAQVSVRDSGPGLDASTVRRIFEPLFSTKAKGLGMGLAISRALIEAQSGQLWAESAGEGALFHFTLPFDEGLTG